MTEATAAADLAGGTASAPGDLPWTHVLEREALKAEQFRHDNTIDPRSPSSAEAVNVTATSGAAMEIRSAVLEYTVVGSEHTGISVDMERTVTWDPSSRYLDVWSARIPPQPDGAVVRYRIRAETGDGAIVLAHDGSGFWYREGAAGLTTFAYRVGQRRSQPSWMLDVVTYQVFVDRFRGDQGQLNGGKPNTKHGGTLGGVADALPYLSELGIDCIWLSPVGPSPTYHRYDQLDFYAVAEEIGGLEALRQLTAAAHERGIRIILDFVPSHTSHLMPEFLAAQADPTADSYAWFDFGDSPDEYRSFLGFIKSLPSFNGNDEGLRSYINGSVRFWLDDVGLDGLRLDHVIGHGSDFWVQFTEAALAANPEAAIFGEATDTPQMLHNFAGQLPGILDFPLANAVRSTFATADWTAGEFHVFARAYKTFLATGPDRVVFIDNHDMDRFLFLAGGDTRRLRMALLFLLTLPNPPVLYYGTEIGLSQDEGKDAAGFGGDDLVRADMPWHRDEWDTNLLAFVKSLIAIRKGEATLRRGTWESLGTAGDIYQCRVGHDEATFELVFNLGTSAEPVTIQGEVVLATEDAAVSANGKLSPLAAVLTRL